MNIIASGLIVGIKLAVFNDFMDWFFRKNISGLKFQLGDNSGTKSAEYSTNYASNKHVCKNVHSVKPPCNMSNSHKPNSKT